MLLDSICSSVHEEELGDQRTLVHPIDFDVEAFGPALMSQGGERRFGGRDRNLELFCGREEAVELLLEFDSGLVEFVNGGRTNFFGCDRVRLMDVEVVLYLGREDRLVVQVCSKQHSCGLFRVERDLVTVVVSDEEHVCTSSGLGIRLALHL